MPGHWLVIKLSICHINGRLGSAFLKCFSEGFNFVIFSTDLRALLLRLMHCNLTRVGLETCWFWSAKKQLPRHPTVNNSASDLALENVFNIRLTLLCSANIVTMLQRSLWLYWEMAELWLATCVLSTSLVSNPTQTNETSALNEKLIIFQLWISTPRCYPVFFYRTLGFFCSKSCLTSDCWTHSCRQAVWWYSKRYLCDKRRECYPFRWNGSYCFSTFIQLYIV